MPGRIARIGFAAAFVGLLLPAPAAADQTFNFSLGYFVVRGEDSRVENDVLVDNLNFLAFNLRDFNHAAAGAEWLVGLGEFVEAGVGAGFYSRSVPSVYARLVDSDGTEIEQDLKLRIVPLTATVRLFPLGRSTPFQPYVGGGVALYNWRYSETGEFVDLRDDTIFRDRFIATGRDAGPIILAGVRAPFGSRFSAGAEIRFQRAQGTVDFVEGPEPLALDLGGITSQFNFGIRF